MYDVATLISMATPLPVELWEHIAAQLPPPPPKLVPVICFCNDAIAVTKTTHMIGSWTITISKAVHEEEARAIVQICQKTNGHPYFTSSPLGHVDSVVSKAFTYGWDFSSDFDRKSYENRGRTFRMVKRT